MDNNMDYEKKYKEALERAKVMWEQGMMPERIEYIFPELKESEDEWIEQQEEQKPMDVNSIIYKAISEVCYTGDPKGFAEKNQTVFKVAQRVAEMCQKHAEWSEEDEDKLNHILE